MQMSLELLNESMEDWNAKIAAAEEMMPVIGRLFRERSIETSIFGRLLNNRTTINIIKCCRFARQVENEELSVNEAQEVLKEIQCLNLTPCHVDIGKLAVNYRRHGGSATLSEYIKREFKYADNESIYILHPNGESQLYRSKRNIFENSPRSQVRVYPGSIIFVPKALDESAPRRLAAQAYVSILGNLGIALASLSAINDD